MSPKENREQFACLSRYYRAAGASRAFKREVVMKAQVLMPKATGIMFGDC